MYFLQEKKVNSDNESIVSGIFRDKNGTTHS